MQPQLRHRYEMRQLEEGILQSHTLEHIGSKAARIGRTWASASLHYANLYRARLQRLKQKYCSPDPDLLVVLGGGKTG